MTKELQIQDSGTSVSLYNDSYVDDSESHYLPGENSNTVGDTLKSISFNSNMMLLIARRSNVLDHMQKGGLKSNLTKKLNSSALAAPEDVKSVRIVGQSGCVLFCH